jgi:hypothetical protein
LSRNAFLDGATVFVEGFEHFRLKVDDMIVVNTARSAEAILAVIVYHIYAITYICLVHSLLLRLRIESRFDGTAVCVECPECFRFEVNSLITTGCPEAILPVPI